MKPPRIKSEIRFHKERLFRDGRIEVAGINVSLKALESAEAIKVMASSIRQGIENCLTTAHTNISSFTSIAGLTNDIAVVMAGGGAEMRFLREAVGKPMVVQGTQFNFNFVTTEPPNRLNMHGAGYARLAVGLGGAQESYEKVVQEHEKLVRLSSLGAPKQRIERWTS